MATRMHAISAYQGRRQPELSGNPRRFAQGLAQLGPHGAPLDESCDPVDGPRDVLEASSYRMVVSSGRVFDRSGPLYYDYMKNYDASSDRYFTLFSLSRTLTVRDKYSYRNH